MIVPGIIKENVTGNISQDLSLCLQTEREITKKEVHWSFFSLFTLFRTKTVVLYIHVSVQDIHLCRPNDFYYYHIA